MAQSFQHISTSLGEAERKKNGRDWTEADYDSHSARGYKIDQSRRSLNVTLVSANGLNEREWVNQFLEQKMIEANAAKHAAWDKKQAAKVAEGKKPKAIVKERTS